MQKTAEGSLPLFFAPGEKSSIFLPKGLQSAARIICPSETDKFHTGSLRGIFSHAQAARENDCNFSRLRTRTLQGFGGSYKNSGGEVLHLIGK